MNYKMMGKFLSQILIVEAGFMVPALLISLYTGSRAAVYSILGDVEALSPGIMYWRSFSHWLGGMGVLVFLLALSPNGERGKGYTMHLLRAESPGPNVNKLVPKMRTTARILYVIYMVLTFINFLFLLLGKMPVLQDTAHIYRMYVRSSCFCLESTSAVIICF